MLDCDCPADNRCDRCVRSTLSKARPQARGLGEQWAEGICRGELRGRAWSEVDPVKMEAIARRWLAKFGDDPRVALDLVVEFLAGAGHWWNWRPARYRL